MSGRYLGRKLAQAVVTIAAILVLNFLMFRLMPGSPDRVLRNPNLSPQVIAETRARWGLDKDLFPDQLVAYVQSTLSGDLGYSIYYRGQPVGEVVGDAVGPTLLLVGLAEVIAIVVGLLVGAYAGWRRGGSLDRVGNGLSLILYSMPYFVIGMPLIIIFAAGLHWFPTSGMTSAGAERGGPVAYLIDLARHLVLPLAAVSLGLIGGYSILMRASIIETRGEDYVTTAQAKGLTDSRVLRAHAFPNALLPMVTLIAINLGYVIAGAITAEIVFNWPGLGTLTIDALNARDYPVLQAIFLLVSVSVVVANLLADIVYGYLDPRVRV
ncbi:MAG: ABC transporter permease [Chloroflexota bacterium]